MSLYAVASSLRDEASNGLRMIDFDASANTRPTPAVVAAVTEALSEQYGNPSSAHRRGEAARGLLTKARDALASLVEGAFGEGVTFTSGCTEANNLVLFGFARAGVRIVSSTVEHPSVLACLDRIAADGGDVEIVPVDAGGRLDMSSLQSATARRGPVLVSIQAANSETGVLQDMRAIASLVAKSDRAIFHSDAAQAFGKLDLEMVRGIGPDIVTMSGHKLHAPMGIGAMIVADDMTDELLPLIMGGEQEGGLRAGTQAVPAIAGLAAACAEWLDGVADRLDRLAAMRDLLEQRLSSIEGVTVNGSRSPRLLNVSSVTFRGCDAMALVANLDERGVMVSQGSACSSRRPQPSHVLLAMGRTEDEAFSTIRFSLSVLNAFEDVEEAADVVSEVVHMLRARP